MCSRSPAAVSRERNSTQYIQRMFLSERKGKVIPCRRTEDRKGTGSKGGESGARNLEAERGASVPV